MPLQDLERKQFTRRARSTLLDRIGQAGRAQGYMGGPTGGQFGMSSGGQPSAGEMGAFNERKKNRALYGKYGKGGLERERLGVGAGLQREGLRSAEKVEGIRAGATTGAAKIRGGAVTDVAKITAGRPQFHYGERKDQMGATTGFDIFKDGQLMQPQGRRPGELDWTKTLKGDQLEQAGEVLKRKMARMKPEEIESFLDEMYRTNPALGQYVTEAEEARTKTPTYKIGRQDKGYKFSIGDYISKRVKEQVTLPFRIAKKPYELGKRVLGAEMPEWLR